MSSQANSEPSDEQRQHASSLNDPNQELCFHFVLILDTQTFDRFHIVLNVSRRKCENPQIFLRLIQRVINSQARIVFTSEEEQYLVDAVTTLYHQNHTAYDRYVVCFLRDDTIAANQGAILSVIELVCVESMDRVDPSIETIIGYMREDLTQVRERLHMMGKQIAIEECCGSDGGTDDSICPICLDEFSTGTKMARFPCSVYHVFCVPCVWELLLTSTVKCPMCRFELQ